MFEIAEKYKNKIQIAFKPHPLLKSKLSKPEVWGKQITDDFYTKWNEMENGQLNEADYIDLFMTSDAMIHDSATFITEYLVTLKPVMYLIHDDDIINRFNEIGKIAFAKHYHGRNKEQIESFIFNVVLEGIDIMKEERAWFVNKYVKPPYGQTASINIFNYIKREIFEYNKER
jgi:CDP-glycerol glycerophosphotransferase (TagB/SpsB family)